MRSRLRSLGLGLGLALALVGGTGCEQTNMAATGKCLDAKGAEACDACCKDNGAKGRNPSSTACKCLGGP